MSLKGYSPGEMARFRHLIGIGEINLKPEGAKEYLRPLIMGEDWELKSRAQKSVHAVEDALNIAFLQEWEWEEEIKCYHIWYPSEFHDNPLSVSYYSDGQISYSRGDDINVTNADDWYLTTLRKHLREFYPYIHPVTNP